MYLTVIINCVLFSAVLQLCVLVEDKVKKVIMYLNTYGHDNKVIFLVQCKEFLSW